MLAARLEMQPWKKGKELEMALNKDQLIKNMTDCLPMLRKALGITQEELAGKLGLSRSTVTAIEAKKREMTWNTFLSLILLFTKNPETNRLLSVLNIYTEEFDQFIMLDSAPAEKAVKEL